MYASQNVQVFSSLRRPETHFKHTQGHQQVGALQAPLSSFKTQLLQGTK